MKRLFKENYTEENLIGRKITTAYGADRDPHNAKPATIVDAHRRRTSTGIVFDLTVELDDTGETIYQTFNPLSVGDKYTWGPWFRDGEEKKYNPYEEEYSESRKLVKEGAGAGYDVGISELEIGEVTDIQKDDEFGYTFTAKIVPGTYEISAEDYYNDFFWQEHELGITPKAKIDGGEIHGTICPWEDTDDPEFWIQRQVDGSTFNLSFMYGAGWMHVDLPEDGQIYVDEHLDITPELYFSIDDIHLDAIDLVQAVNSGHASIFDRDEEEDDEEPVGESTGAAKINLTWDEFNKLCDLIDMDWKRWNKNNAKSIPLVADRAVEHLEWIANKKLKGLDPKDVTISYMIPGSGIDEYDTGTQNTQTIYELIEGMAWDNYNPYNESALGRRNPKKSDESRRIDESYDTNGDDGRKRVMDALDEFTQVLWDDTKVKGKKEHELRQSFFDETVHAISTAIQKYFKYTRI